MASQQQPVTAYQTSGFQFEYREVPTRKTHKEIITRTEYDQYSGSILYHEEEIDVPDELDNGYNDPSFQYSDDELF